MSFLEQEKNREKEKRKFKKKGDRRLKLHLEDLLRYLINDIVSRLRCNRKIYSVTMVRTKGSYSSNKRFSEMGA